MSPTSSPEKAHITIDLASQRIYDESKKREEEREEEMWRRLQNFQLECAAGDGDSPDKSKPGTSLSAPRADLVCLLFPAYREDGEDSLIRLFALFLFIFFS